MGPSWAWFQSLLKGPNSRYERYRELGEALLASEDPRAECAPCGPTEPPAASPRCSHGDGSCKTSRAGRCNVGCGPHGDTAPLAAAGAQEDPAAAACPSTYEEVRQRLIGGASCRATRPSREGKTTLAHLPAPAYCAELNRESPWLRVIYVADNRELCMRLVPGAIYAAEEFLDRVAAVG
jgi:hypothetical protein